MRPSLAPTAGKTLSAEPVVIVRTLLKLLPLLEVTSFTWFEVVPLKLPLPPQLLFAWSSAQVMAMLPLLGSTALIGLDEMRNCSPLSVAGTLFLLTSQVRNNQDPV